MNKIEKDTRLDLILNALREYNRGNFDIEELQAHPDGDKLDKVAYELNQFRYKAASFKFGKDTEKRINNILEVILRYTILDFSKKANISGNGDELDAIAVGLNTLAEELQEKILREEKNRADLERFLFVLQATSDSVLTLRTDGLILNWNKGATKMYGFTAEEVVEKKNILDFVVPGEQEHMRAILQRVAAGEEIANYHDRRIRKDQKVIEVSVTLSPIFDANNNVISIATIARDITLQREQEELLRKSEETFRLLVKSVRDYAIFKLDTNGYVSSWNIGAEKITGYKEEEIIGKHFSIFLTEEDKKSGLAEKELQVALERGDFQTTGPRLRKDGSIFWSEAVCTPSYNERGEFTGYSKVFKDITEERKAQEIIRESKEQIETIISNAPSAVVVSTEQENVINWNSKAKEIFGWETTDILNEPVYNLLLSEKDAEKFRGDLDKFLKEGHSFFINKFVEVTAVRKNGEEFPAEMGVSAVKSKDNFLFIAFITDITERKKTEAALHHAYEDLDMANKELESFSYSVSHDLRAPLRAIHGYATILHQEVKSKLNDDENTMMQSILRNTQKMGQLIDDLLALSRLGKKELQRKTVDMNEIVQDALKSFTENPAYAKAKVILSDLPPAFADPHLISQVYYNLLSNAFKYSSGKPDPVIEVGAKTENGNITYFVKDNGAGFNMEYYDKLFGVFQRLHDSDQFEGTGVGLAIVKRIIDRHNGKIWANSKSGEGAIFYFMLQKEPENGTRKK